MRVGLQNAARLGRKIIPLQPFDRLDPADDGEPAFAVVGDKHGRVAARGFFQEGSVVGRLSTRSIETSRACERRQIVASVGLVSLRSIWLMIDLATPDCSDSSDSERL